MSKNTILKHLVGYSLVAYMAFCVGVISGGTHFVGYTAPTDALLVTAPIKNIKDGEYEKALAFLEGEIDRKIIESASYNEAIVTVVPLLWLDSTSHASVIGMVKDHRMLHPCKNQDPEICEYVNEILGL